MIAIKIQGVMKGYFSQVKGAEGDGGGGDREGGGHLLALFFFFFFFYAGAFLKQVDRSQMRQVLAQKSSNIDNSISTGVENLHVLREIISQKQKKKKKQSDRFTLSLSRMTNK